MQIPSTITVQALATGEAPAPALKAWQVGQLLKGTVTQLGPANNFTLRIGDQSLQAQSPLTLTPGQSLQLEVVRAGAQPVLKLLPPSSPETAGTQALRTALPQQAPLGPLLANLRLLAGAATESPAGALGNLIKPFFMSLPEAKTLTQAAGLQHAIANSGLFLEAKLVQAGAGQTLLFHQDLKAQWLRLMQSLSSHAGESGLRLSASTQTPLPPAPWRHGGVTPQGPALANLSALSNPAEAAGEILQQTQGSLARLVMHQLASLPTESQPQALWLMELPVRREQGVDVWHLRIARDQQGKQDAQARGWSVSLAFDLRELGPVRARIWVNAAQVTASLWVERAASAEIFNTHLDSLQAGLQAAGFSHTQLSCVCGLPPAEQAPDGTAGLLDLHA